MMRRLCNRLMRVQHPLLVNRYDVSVSRLGFLCLFPHISTPPQAHGYYEVLLLLEGKLLVNRQQYDPGALICFSPGIRHTILTLDVPILAMMLNFSLAEEVRFVYPKRWPARPDLIWELGLLLHDIREGVPGWQQRGMWRLGLLISHIMAIGEWQPGEGVQDENWRERIITTIDTYLYERMADKIYLSDVASHVNLSVREVTRLYRQMTGTTIMKHLLEMRIVRAGDLIADTSLPIEQIREIVGLPDGSYFRRCFRLLTTSSPRQFRNDLGRVNR